MRSLAQKTKNRGNNVLSRSFGKYSFQTPLNEALRYGFRNIVELLLKKGASLNMSEKSEDGTEVFPMDIAQKDVALLGSGDN